MRRKPIFSKMLFSLIIAGLILPVIISVVVALAALLTAMNDSTGGAVLRYVALAGGAAWAVDVIAIVFLQAIDALNRPDDENG